MTKITKTAQTVLEKRIFQPGETCWDDVTDRVAKHFATRMDELKQFAFMLDNMDALPNSPCLANAGTKINSFSACFVLPVEDSIESIFRYYTNAALIGKSGGGIGCNFSHLRERGCPVGSTLGVASGPLSFMGGQDALTEVIKQGGKRRGANMGILACDHPEVMDMVKAKDTPGVLENFNLSVLCTDEFMDRVTFGYTDAQSDSPLYPDEVNLWDEMMQRAWSCGEPGVLFVDRAERDNMVPHLGKLDATNPCGEQWLRPYESCSLISINLSNFVHDEGEEGKIVNWPRLRSTIHTAVLFMNRVLDKSEFPIPECQKAMELTRNIGVGIMGLHDMLIQLGFGYDSEHGRDLASLVMKFVREECDVKSRELGESEGFYLAAETWDPIENKLFSAPLRRNAALTSIQPTGTCSMIADCSSGCEPYYAPVTIKEVLDGERFVMTNKWLPANIKQTLELHDYVKLEDLEGEGFDLNLFKGAEDIHWKDHIKMQAVLQKHVDSSISKTINMPSDCTVEDVKEAYEYAWKEGCKGLTIYRNGSRETQVLSAGDGEKQKDVSYDPSGILGQDVGTPGEDRGHRREDGYACEEGETPVPKAILGTDRAVQPGACGPMPLPEVCDRRDPSVTGCDSEGTSRAGREYSDGPSAEGFAERCGDSEVGNEGRMCCGSEKTEEPVSPGPRKAGPIDELPTPFKLELPEELNARRYRVRDTNGNKVYFTVCTMDGQPVEVFARLPEEVQDSNWHVISRLVSLALRYNIPLKDVCKQLQKSSSSIADNPVKLARILDTYQEQEEYMRGVDNPCPDCGCYLIPEGGCFSCKDCGYSKCL